MNGPHDKVQTIIVDTHDHLLLVLSRHLFLYPQSPADPHWKTAVSQAQNALPVNAAARLVQALWRIVRLVGHVRSSAFEFLDVYDPIAQMGMTADECTLLQMVHFLRDQNITAARAQCIIMCQGGPQEQIMLEAGKLTDALQPDDGDDQQKTV